MREVLPTELLLRLMNATPEQYAAVAEILGCRGDGSWELEDRTNRTEGTKSARADARPTVSEDVARSAFALLQRLDADKHGRKPTLLAVFRLYCVDGLSAKQVAVKCRCAKATVLNRLRIIEERTGTKADGFRAVSGHLTRLEDEFNDSRAREVYGRGLADKG